MKTFPKARTSDIVVSDYKDETLLYDLQSHKCHSLNKTAYSVWQECNGKRDIDQVARRIKGNAPGKAGDQLVTLTLNELAEIDLLEEADTYRVGPGISRREMIRKVGKASMIALPLIASISAPKAEMAASCAPLGGTCVISRNCCGFRRGCNSGTCCSNIQGTCVTDSDCCGAGTSCPTGTCCVDNNFQCVNDADCCSGNCGPTGGTEFACAP